MEIEQAEWSEVLKVKSCIQCGKGHLNCIEVEKFKELYEKDKLTFIGSIPGTLALKIKQAINASITYTFVEQRVLTNEK